MRPLARLKEHLDVNAGLLQTLAALDEARELAEAAVLVSGVCVLQKRISIATICARSISVYLLVGACARR